MTTSSIKVIPTPYEGVVALLRSNILRDVEQAIASRVGSVVHEELSSVCTSLAQADASVSGMTLAQIETLLSERRDEIVAFGVRFLRDDEATSDDEEYPEGEEPDPSPKGTVLGLGTGFGVKYAIYFNFLANRTPAEFREYLKNRRIPQHAKFEKELRRIYEEVHTAGL
jgi:hypothetical protein